MKSPVFTRPAITCSKLTIETLTLLLTYFIPCSNVSIVNFEQVNAGWVCANQTINTRNKKLQYRYSDYPTKQK